MITSLITVFALAAQGTLTAQDVAPPAGTEAAPVTSERAVRPGRLARDVLNDKGWTEGYNPEIKRFIVIGEEPIAVEPGHPDWPSSRSAAYTMAMLDAKRDLAQHLSAEISRRMGYDKQKPDPAAAFEQAKAELAKRRADKVDPNDMSMTDKVVFLAHQEIDALIDDEKKMDPVEVEQKIEAVVLRKDFRDRIALAAHAETAGLASYQCFESNNSVAVIALFTEDATLEAGKAMLGKGSLTRKASKKDPLNVWCSGLKSSGALMYTFGVRLRTDENGDLNVIAFGHVPAEYDDPELIDVAIDAAVTLAMGELRSFAGEIIDNTTVLDRASTTEKIADESRRLTTRYTSRSAFDQSVKADSETLRLPGSHTVFEDLYQHPDMLANEDTRPIAVAVVSWNTASAQAAAELHGAMERLKSSRGGAGVQPRSAEDGAVLEPGESVAPKGGRGASGDDDDFGG